VLDLDGVFGLHPALAPIHGWFGEGGLLPVHAVATPYRDRSHFDAQDLLENGTPRPHGAADGWLNRALAFLEADGSRLGLAVGTAVPLVLRGEVPVAAWSPPVIPAAEPDFLERVAVLWRGDAALAGLLEEAMAGADLSGRAMGDLPRGRGRQGLAMATAAGRLLAEPEGPRIAVLELGGWDTHAGQGTVRGRMAAPLAGLAAALAALREALGPAWALTAGAAVTEFGRTVVPNGTGGTDHGTAGAALVFGGAVAGGRVLARWPGLGDRDLLEGRDLAPTQDLRAILAALLIQHARLPEHALATVFPGLASALGERLAREA
jgi:uncharacterized protein (DUF1501 family)